MKFTFSKPYTYEGKEYTEIEMDLEGLTGKDVSLAKRAFTRFGGYSPIIATDVEFCTFLATKAAKLPFEFVEKLPAKDYCRLGQEVSNFLMA